MKIEIVEVEEPICRSYGMFYDISKDEIQKTGVVRVVPEYITKTRIHTSLLVGQAMKGINLEVDGIKTHRSVETGWYPCHYEDVRHYFVKSKKQDFETYKKYVQEVVRIAMNLIGVELDELKVELEVW